jgi:two-component system nitrogen regulation sensor histidine kinase GlnL
VLAENHHISFSADYDPSIPELYADESMMIQVILNITRNAVIAIESIDNKNGKIKFKTRTQRNCKIGIHTYPLVAKIDIEDNGGGVAEELQEKIFMPMITGHAEGTGLGLSIAQTLVQQHNGLIEFTSEPGKTIFTILLPINTHNGAGA